MKLQHYLNKKLLGSVLFVVVIVTCVGVLIRKFSDKNYRNTLTKPHVIVIIADDMGWNDVSYHGSNEIPTPNIDALAYNGVILRNHYVLPICTPSRTAFFTGRYPIREGMYGFPLRAGEDRGIPLNITLLPEHLRNLGYDTHMVGKWHLGYYNNESTPTFRGFNTFYGYYNGYITYFNHTIKQSNERGYDMHRDHLGQLKPDKSHLNEYATDVFTDEAIKVINEHNDGPLYLQISHLAPHASDAEETLETRNLTQVNQQFGYIKDLKRRKYAGLMSALDESVGRIVQALDEKKLLKNSVIVFMADNGAQTIGEIHPNSGSNYPLRGVKFTLFEGGVHGVACIYSPLIKRRRRVMNDLIHVTDWLPTFYSMAGGNPIDLGLIDGINQWPVITQQKFIKIKRQSLLLNIDPEDGTEAAIAGKFKLIKGKTLLDGFYGSDADASAPEYNLTSVLSSPANIAIHNSTKVSVTFRNILQLREKSEILCKPFVEYSNCSERCLFQLNDDPCETTDVSDQHPEVVLRLENFIDRYKTVVMKQKQFVSVDPRAFPRNFNGFWMPWL